MLQELCAFEKRTCMHENIFFLSCSYIYTHGVECQLSWLLDTLPRVLILQLVGKIK